MKIKNTYIVKMAEGYYLPLHETENGTFLLKSESTTNYSSYKSISKQRAKKLINETNEEEVPVEGEETVGA